MKRMHSADTQPHSAGTEALALAPGSVTYALFKHMADEHGLTLLESEMAEIVRIVNENLEARLRWWITNAEEIAKERAELFRAGECMAAMLALAPTAQVADWPTDEQIMAAVGAWNAAAQPIRDMASSPNSVIQPQREA